jgi:hypothetical protein
MASQQMPFASLTSLVLTRHEFLIGTSPLMLLCTRRLAEQLNCLFQMSAVFLPP